MKIRASFYQFFSLIWSGSDVIYNFDVHSYANDDDLWILMMTVVNTVMMVVLVVMMVFGSWRLVIAMVHAGGFVVIEMTMVNSVMYDCFYCVTICFFFVLFLSKLLRLYNGTWTTLPLSVCNKCYILCIMSEYDMTCVKLWNLYL